jgi:ABC-type phosphate transport system permease subunit
MRNRYRRALSHLVMSLCALSVLAALVPLALVLFYVLTQGLSSLNWAFLTDMPRPVGEPGGGMANAIVGSLIVVGLGALFAVPIGIFSGVYASEYAARRSPERSVSPPTPSTASRPSSSASSPTASRCCRSGSSRPLPAASLSGS